MRLVTVLLLLMSLSACNQRATPPVSEVQPNEPTPEAPTDPKPDPALPVEQLIARGDAYAVGFGGVLEPPPEQGVLANDSSAAGRDLSAAVFLPPRHGSLTLAADGSFRYQHGGGEAVEDSFTYTVSDGEVSSSAVVTLFIDDETPRPGTDVYELAEGAELVVAPEQGVLANDRDPQGKLLSAGLVAAPQYGNLNLKEDGSFSYTHAGGEAPYDAFTYGLTNGAKSIDVTVKLNIAPVNDAPYADVDGYSLGEGESLRVASAAGLLANDIDVDSESLSVTVETEPRYGTLELLADGAFTYQHDHSEGATDSFRYRLSDGEQSVIGEVHLTLTPLDDAPTVTKLELAQTHVTPPEGTTWEGEKLADYELHVVGSREALVLVDVGSAAGRIVAPVLEAHVNGVSVGELALNLPDTLPPTEADGPSYSATAYWATLDKTWVQPGLELRVRANEGQASEFTPVNVGAPGQFTMYTLPFYLFGLDESDVAFSEVAAPDEATRTEYFAKHPVAELEMLNHPAGKVQWPYIIVGPRQGRAAQKVSYKEQQGDGYAVMAATLQVLHAVRNANGDAPLSNQYYAPLLMAKQSGAYGGPGGGLGGGGVGTGDHSYTGIFVHEAGHAFGMPHANDGYRNGTYPYAGGSLQGSAWGYDAGRKRFIPTFVPSSSPNFGTCQDWNIQFDNEGRCVKQDPMQGGSGYQAAGDKYAIFSDFNASVVQRYVERSVIEDAASATGYSRWSAATKRFEVFDTATGDKGLWGLNRNLAVHQDVPVHTVIVTLSQTTPEASQIYPPLSYQGKLLEMIDPTDSAQLAAIAPNVGTYPWYCHASGCDYTLRVTYADGSVAHVVLQGAFRKWPWGTGVTWGDYKDGINDPTSGDSFKTWGVNVPGNKALKTLELLHTPEVYNGLASEPEVLLSRSLD